MGREMMLKGFDIYPAQNSLTLGWLEVSGPDALDFLQRLTTVNFKKVRPTPGELPLGYPGAILDAQGKVQVFFWTWRLEEDRFLFEVEAGATVLADLLERFHFSERIQIRPVFEEKGSRLSTYWAISNDQEALDFSGGAHSIDGIKFFAHRSVGVAQRLGRVWLSLVCTHDAFKASGLSQALKSEEDFEELRIPAMLPKVGVELNSESSLLEAGLPEAVSSQKGCYPGQEVVERIRALGSPARRLVSVEIWPVDDGAPGGSESRTWAPGEPLLWVEKSEPKANADGGPVQVGTLTSVGKKVGLAYLKKRAAKGGELLQTPSGVTLRVSQVSQYGEVADV